MADQAAEAREDPIQAAREQRLMTLALADQINTARWDEPALPGGVSLHATLAHLLGWEEWATAVFEVSALRELPARLVTAYREVDAFNARSVARFAGVSRADLFASLQGANTRLVSSALAVGGAQWAERRIPELAPPPQAGADSQPHQPSRGPSVGGLLRMLARHEREHAQEISATFGVSVDLERMRADANGEAATAGERSTDAPGPRATEQPQRPADY